MSLVYQISDNLISPLGFTTLSNFDAVVSGSTGLKYYAEGSLGVPEAFCAALIERLLLHEQCHAAGIPQDYTDFDKLIILSATLALRNTGIDASSERTVFILSTTKGNISLLAEGFTKGSPDKRLFLWHSAGLLSDFFNNPNKPMVVSNACISGVSAQLVARQLLLSGRFDYAVVVGADLVSKFVVSGFQSFKSLSQQVCRPFDAAREGLNIGEAAGTIVLGRASGVDELPANNLYIAGGSITNDANHISGPSRTAEGLYRAIASAVKTNNHEEPGFICAHGTATPYNDEMEAIALNRVHMQHIPVFSLKAYFGHTLGAAGLIETIIASQALRQSVIPANAGYNECGVSQPVAVNTETKAYACSSFLKTVSGFGGCNAAMLVKKKEVN